MKQGIVVRSEDIEDHRLGIVHAFFRWNAIEDDKKPSSSGPDTLPKSTASSVVESEPVPGDSISVSNQGCEDHKFELRDINVVFPDRQMTVVTGPSMFHLMDMCVGQLISTIAASGKSALLVSVIITYPRMYAELHRWLS